MDAAQPYIMVIDDLLDAADSLAEMLTLWGYDAKPLYSGAAGLEAARDRRPAVVLLDLGMPRMSGLQFALRFRNLSGCEATPIVAVTAHHTLTLQTREVGIDYCLLKTVDFSILRELLRQLTASIEARVRAEPRRPWKARLTRSSLS